MSGRRVTTTHDRCEVSIVVAENGAITRLEVTPRRERISSDVLRSIPVARLHREALAYLDPDAKTPSSTSPGRGRRMTDEHLGAVADVYRQASEGQAPPTKAVATQLAGGNASTAARWVMQARERGFLGSSLGPGRAGEAQ